MGPWIAMLMPFALLLARIGAFFAVLPIFSSTSVPMRIRAATAVLVTFFFAFLTPPPPGVTALAPLASALLLSQEVLAGLALGLAAALVYRSVQVGARFAGRQMGFAAASRVDPSTGDHGAPVGLVFETAFLLLFLAAGGHHLLLLAIRRSFEAFPVGSPPRIDVLIGAILRAGTAMLLFGMKLAAPVLAAFVVLSVLLGVLARALPEMNVLMLSFPVRVGLGLFLAAAILPAMNDFTIELAQWMNGFLVS